MNDDFICSICGYKGNAKVIYTQDYNYRISTELFRYCTCPKCGCLQNMTVPSDMGQYYRNNYYSFKADSEKHPIKKILRQIMRIRDAYEITQTGAGKILTKLLPYAAYRKIGTYANVDSKILDVGCGDGYLVKLLAELGFKNVIGVDLYFDEGSMDFGGVRTCFRLIHGEISDVEEKDFDLIVMRHSLEHMNNQEQIFREISNKLAAGATAIISIPVANSRPLEKYGRYWFQLDAPRHLFIHSLKSISLLAENEGLEIQDIIYDESSLAYIGSRQYKRNKDGNYRRSIRGILEWMLLGVLKYGKEAKKDNELGRGDQATFILRKRE